MATISVERVIGAGPTGTALLLAGPTAYELWPGVTRIEGSREDLWIDAPALAAGAALIHVHALPPRRLPTAYVSRFGFGGAALPETHGEVTLSYAAPSAATADVPAATRAVLALTWTPSGTTADRARVAAAFRAMAEGFLANLAAAAEERSYAA
jgi:hypothetical protein